MNLATVETSNLNRSPVIDLIKQFRYANSKKFLLLILVFVYTSSKAGVFSIENYILGPNFISSPVGLPVVDVDYVTPYPLIGFTDTKVEAYTYVSINHQYNTHLITSAYKYKINLTIDFLDNTLALHSITRDFIIEYDPSAGIKYQDRDAYNFNDAHQIKVTINSIKDFTTGTTITAPEQNITITYGLKIERYLPFDFSSSGATCISYSPISDVKDLNSDGENDEIEVHWGTLTGAEEYELEWTYVDDYVASSLTGTIPSSAIEYSFVGNSTRINTKHNSYKINLIYERGYLFFRVRGVGRNLSNPTIMVYGAWSESDNGIGVGSLNCGTGAFFYCSADHMHKLNWQYSSTYAEDGKKKEVISYYDGSLRDRQSVTKVNTNEKAIVGESYYDYNGRKAVNALPVPVPQATSASQALTYYENFNKNNASTPVKYSREDFDIDQSACATPAGAMSTSTGASKYYSPNNPDQTNQQAYVPDANRYPFSQVEYTPDNTGRIRRQGGVGQSHQLNSNKETKYYYGSPNQEELDRLFGSEVGYARHYKKNVVVDANGQVSISYLDQKGHVIATALSGNTPENVAAISSGSGSPESVTVDLFAKDYNGISLVNNSDMETTSLIFNTQYLVSTPGDHTFDYTLIPTNVYDEVCLGSEICFDCIYDLKIEIINECGDVIHSNVVRVGSLTLNNTCGSVEYVPSAGLPINFTLTGLAVGNYQITKTLTINKEAYEYYLSQYLNPELNTCLESYETMLAEETEKLSSVPCTLTCSECVESLGTLDAYILSGKGTEEDWQRAYNQCNEPCNNDVSKCEAAYNMMLGDMSPSGQYAEYFDSTSTQPDHINPEKFQLSILSKYNVLPDNGLPYTNADGAYWKNPKLGANYGYFEEDGTTRSSIEIIEISTGVYSPACVGIDNMSNGKIYTWPEHLTNVSDFIKYWKPSWAKSLVKYHPEYCYYSFCVDRILAPNTVGKYSEPFDKDVLNTDTYDSARIKGYIDDIQASAGLRYLYALLDLDPYFNDNVTTNKSSMESELTNFKNTGKNAYQVAVVTEFYPAYFDDYSSMSSTLFDCPSGATTQQLDNIWNRFKFFYTSLKQKYQKLDADESMLQAGSACKKYNGCIGEDQYNPFTGIMGKYLLDYTHPFSSSPYNDLDNQPCARATYILYKNKKKRFSAGDDDFVKMDAEKANFNYFKHTGICPVARDVLGFLFQTINTNNLITSPQNCVSMQGMSKLLYDEINHSSTWVTTYPNSIIYTCSLSGNTAFIIFKDYTGTHIIGNITLNLVPYAATLDWTKVKSVKTMNSFSSSVFSMVVYYDSSGTTVEHKVNGTTDIVTGDCTFYDQCKLTDFGNDLTILLSALANNDGGTSKLNSTSNVDLGSTSTPFIHFVSRFIFNSIPSSASSNATWKMTGSGTFSLFRSSDATNDVVVTFQSYAPSTTTLNNSNLNYIKSFKSVKVNPVHPNTGVIFTVIYNDGVHGDQQSEITADISVGGMFDCYEPVPVACETNEHQTERDLGKLISDIFSTQPVVNNTSLSSKNTLTTLLQSYLAVNTSGTSNIKLNPVSTTDDKFTATILVDDSAKCEIVLYRLDDIYKGVGHSFTSIYSFQNIKADPSKLINGKAYNFTIEAIFEHTGTTPHTYIAEKIGGYTTCFPIKHCDNCNDAITVSGCKYDKGLVLDARRKYNLNMYVNNDTHLLIDSAYIDELTMDCDCMGKYIEYLKNYPRTATTAPLTPQDYILSVCSPVCSDYNKYLAAIGHFNSTLGSTYGMITPVPASASASFCDCITNYIQYLEALNIGCSCVSAGYLNILDFKDMADCDLKGVISVDSCVISVNYQYQQRIIQFKTMWGIDIKYQPISISDECKCLIKYLSYLDSYMWGTYESGLPFPPVDYDVFSDMSGPWKCDATCIQNYALYAEYANCMGITPEIYDAEHCECYVDYIFSIFDNKTMCPACVRTTSGFLCGTASGYPTIDVYCGVGGSRMSSRSYSTDIPLPKLPRVPCLADTMATDTILYEDYCEKRKKTLAEFNAKARFEQQRLIKTTLFRDMYYQKCLGGITETFSLQLPRKDYHYTLYYYDQAGNLTRTVPPEGVQFIASSDLPKVVKDRTNGTRIIFTNHYLQTVYEYNSLNQLVRQSVPDNEKMNIWSIKSTSGLPTNLVVTDVTFSDANLGYLIGNIASTGSGYIYKTNDGGTTWSRVENIQTSDIVKMQMADASNGYAIGKNGLLLKTINGGADWKILATMGVLTHLNDLFFKDDTHGMVVGNSGLCKRTTDGGVTWSDLSISSIEDIKSMSWDIYTSSHTIGNGYITTINSSGVSNIYKNTDFSTGSWSSVNLNSNTRAPYLNKIQMVSANDGFAIGTDGTLLKTSNGGADWVHIATGITEELIKLCFLPTADKGIVLSKSGTIWKFTYNSTTAKWRATQVSASGDYQDIYFYDKTNGYGYAAGNNSVGDKVLAKLNISASQPVKMLINTSPKVVTYNITSLATYDATSDVFIFGSNSTGAAVCYRTNIFGDFVSYSNVTLSPAVSVSSVIFNTSSTLSLLGENGNVYSGVISGGTINLTDRSVSTTHHYVDIDFDGSNVYAINDNGTLHEVHSAVFGSTLGSAITIGSDIAGLNIAYNKFVCGKDGNLFYIGTSTVNDYSKKTQPLNLFDIKAVTNIGGSSSTDVVYATGADGTILKSVDDGVTWNTLVSYTANNLNAITIYDGTDNGKAVGDGGVIINIATGVSTLVSPAITIQNLYDIYATSSSSVFVCGASNSLFKYNGTSWSQIKLSVPSSDYFALAGNGSDVFFGGTKGLLYKYTSSTSSWSNTLKFTIQLNGMHIPNELGMITGDIGTSLSTSNKGGIWKYNIPLNSENFKKPWVVSSTSVYIVGSGHFAETTNLDASSFSAHISTLPTSGTFTDIKFNEDGYGVISVGHDLYKKTPSSSSWSVISSLSSLTDNINSVSIKNKYVCIVGDNKLAMACSDITTGSPSFSNITLASTLSSVATFDFKKVIFCDMDRGYLAGTNGVLAKVINFRSGPEMKDKSSYISSAYDMQALALNDRTHFVLGGDHYAKMINDESDFVSSLFWYDKLGRLIVSQNTKQFNNSTMQYSFTDYDDLGRIKRVGLLTQGTPVESIIAGKQIDNTYYGAWVRAGGRNQVTNTYYDEQFVSTSVLQQINMRKRVASNTYEEIDDSSDASYQYATHYTYDVHGNVNELVQDIAELAAINKRYYHIKYDYDLVSGKVNQVDYNPGQPDQYSHRYEYDGDNRITKVFTSRDGFFWDNDADYFYYDHGPLARTEIGDLKVQGVDYAYTIHGWIKGVNSDIMSSNNDIGKDGKSGHANQFIGKDAFGYSLGYYHNTSDKDYDDIAGLSTSNRFDADVTGSDLLAHRNDLWNGNISYMVTTIPELTHINSTATPYQVTQNTRGAAYKYDQLNRLTEARSYFVMTGNAWNGGAGSSDAFKELLTYDAMGNIKTATKADQSGTNFDELMYHYNTHSISGNLLSNKLYGVSDVGPGSHPSDIEDQGTFTNSDDLITVNTANNYGYDELGNLKRDNQEEIAEIKWNTYGKIREVIRISTSTKPDLEFKYDAGGNRIVKIVKPKPLNPATYVYNYYLRDAQGNQMAYYKYLPDLSYLCMEHTIYGSSRVGVDSRIDTLVDTSCVDNGAFESVSTLDPMNLSITLNTMLNPGEDVRISTSSGGWINLTSYNSSYMVVVDYLNEIAANLSGLTGASLIYITGNTVYFTFNPAAAGFGCSDNVVIFSQGLVIPYGVTCTTTSVWVPDIECELESKVKDIGINNRLLGSKQYELSNHLGNVLVTISDNKIPFASGGSGSAIDFYYADVTSVNDYYAFGMVMNERSFSRPDYRFGFNGKEIDIETETQDYGMRIYYSALGRFLSVDPLSKSYSWYTPYQFAGNKPLKFIDKDGKEEEENCINREVLKVVVNDEEVRKHTQNFNASADGALSFKYGIVVGVGASFSAGPVSAGLEVIAGGVTYNMRSSGNKVEVDVGKISAKGNFANILEVRGEAEVFNYLIEQPNVLNPFSQINTQTQLGEVKVEYFKPKGPNEVKVESQQDNVSVSASVNSNADFDLKSTWGVFQTEIHGNFIKMKDSIIEWGKGIGSAFRAAYKAISNPDKIFDNKDPKRN